MNRNRLFVFLFCLSLSWWIVPSAATAQSSASVTPSAAFHGSTVGQATSSEVTVTGTIQQTASQAVHAGPRGIHLVLTGTQGVFNANVGPYLSTNVKQSLSAGKQVQVTGVIQAFNGQDYLLVRELTVAGRQIIIRNQYGFLVHPESSTGSRSQHRQNGQNGVAQ